MRKYLDLFLLYALLGGVLLTEGQEETSSEILHTKSPSPTRCHCLGGIIIYLEDERLHALEKPARSDDGFTEIDSPQQPVLRRRYTREMLPCQKRVCLFLVYTVVFHVLDLSSLCFVTIDSVGMQYVSIIV